MKPVRAWRISAAPDSRGLLMYFDPYLEQPLLRDLTDDERRDRLDGSVSVSDLGQAGQGDLFAQDNEPEGLSS